MILDPEDEAFNDIERQAKQRKEVVLAAINKEKPMKDEKAFPAPTYFTDQHAISMTLRDYFAAKAMQGMLASGNLPKTMPDADLAECVYNLADAMLKAREA